ncbi:MAG: tetratricopeptide repeat protein [Alphaproteobacteria bacterium]|nr:tetratricopeptide repeat protein [Alphaproteobacteria bacterium]
MKPTVRPRTAILAALLAAGLGVPAIFGLSALEARQQLASSPPRDGVRDTNTGNFLAGRHAEGQSDLSIAADFMAEALRADPGNMELQRRTMLLLLSAGRASDALPYARRVREAEPGAYIASLLLVADAARANDMSGARRELARTPRENLSGVVAPILDAWVAFAQKGADEALAELRGTGEASPMRAMERFHAGLMADLAGRAALARAEYETSIRAAPRAHFRFVEALASLDQRERGPEAARAALAQFPLESPESPLVQAITERLGEDKPYDRLVRSPAEGIAETFFGVGASLFRQGEHGMALVFARLALHARPQFPVGQFLVAELLESMKRPEEALTVYRAVDESSPFHWEARLRAAAGLSELKRRDEAIEKLKAMSAERATRPDALFRLGNVLREAERFNEAVEAYDGAIARLGPQGPAHWSLYYARGMALERAKRFDAAAVDLEHALKLRPEHPYVLNYLGYMWVDQGVHLDRARDMLRRAVELRPDDGYIVDSWGWFFYRAGDFERAVQHLERAVQLKPADPVINDHLGDAYWRVGRKNEARFQWRRALTFEAPSDLAPAIQRKLEHGLEAATKGGRG